MATSITLRESRSCDMGQTVNDVIASFCIISHYQALSSLLDQSLDGNIK